MSRHRAVAEHFDTRACAVSREHTLTGLDAQILLACDSALSRIGLQRQLAADYRGEEVTKAIEGLLNARLVAEIGNQIVSLPVLRNRPVEAMEAERKVHAAIPSAAHSESLLRIL